MEITETALAPFGLRVRASPSASDLGKVPIERIEGWLAEHRVLLLQGFSLFEGDAFPDYCRSLGELLGWEFGFVNHLKVDAEARNYLFTPAAVPYHWDGAFVGRIPRLIFFQCRSAPPAGSGGETLFCDTTRVLARATDEERAAWDAIEITYSTEKVVHYGGRFTARLVDRVAATGATVLRYAEPVEDLNPVRLEIAGLPPAEHEAFLAGLRGHLYDPATCLSVAWTEGDLLVADNLHLLHGRRAFTVPASRHIERVNIL